MRVVLASASPRRQELLAALVTEFEVAAAEIAEPLGSDAVVDAVGLAAAKAEHVARRAPRAVVLAADTIVFNGHRLFGKPSGAEEARAMLRELSGRDHQVVTGVAVATAGHLLTDASVATVTIRPLTASEIERYVSSGVPLDKAGAYAIQDQVSAVVEGLRGCYCAVVGLPLVRARKLLERAGVACAEPAETFERCRECPDREAMRLPPESA